MLERVKPGLVEAKQNLHPGRADIASICLSQKPLVLDKISKGWNEIAVLVAYLWVYRPENGIIIHQDGVARHHQYRASGHRAAWYQEIHYFIVVSQYIGNAPSGFSKTSICFQYDDQLLFFGFQFLQDFAYLEVHSIDDRPHMGQNISREGVLKLAKIVQKATLDDMV